MRVRIFFIDRTKMRRVLSGSEIAAPRRRMERSAIAGAPGVSASPIAGEAKERNTPGAGRAEYAATPSTGDPPVTPPDLAINVLNMIQ